MICELFPATHDASDFGAPRGAVLSPPETRGGVPFSVYRYALWRPTGSGRGRCVFVLLNPSTADALRDDLTVKKCVGFARRWGYARADLVNLYALRSTDPKALLDPVPDPVGPDCDLWIRRTLLGHASVPRAHAVVAAWSASTPKGCEPRVAEVSEILRASDLPLSCLGLTRSGAPRHPSRLPYATKLEIYNP